MKTSVYFKTMKNTGKDGLSSVCFRVRDTGVDIKVVSELQVVTKYWDEDALCYRKNNVVGKEEQKQIPAQIAAIVEQSMMSYDRNKANSEWLRQVIEDVLHPQQAYERDHPCLTKRIDEYIAHNERKDVDNSQYVKLKDKVVRYIAYNREILGDKDFNLFAETISVDDMYDFRDFIFSEHVLYEEYPDFYARYWKATRKLREISNTTAAGDMSALRTVLNWCRKMGYSQNVSYLLYVGKKVVHGDPFFLTVEERNVLYDADLTDYPRLSAIRDIFVFQCYVGCRVRDLFRLTRDNIKDGFLEYMPQKTKKREAKTVRVPLHDKAKAILKRNENLENGKLLPFKGVVSYNTGIKKLLKHCGIDRMVTILDTHGYKMVQKPLYEVASSHTARKTFIGNLYKKVPDPNLIASMSGHCEGSQAFARYRHIDDEMKEKLIEMIN